jgi:hypothetical protein
VAAGKLPVYDRIADKLQALGGISLLAGEAPLAPTKGFGRASARSRRRRPPQLERLGDGYGPGDEIGQWGL